MLLYNITIAIDKEIEEEWSLWMKSVVLPDSLNTGLIKDCRFYKVVTHDDPSSASYCVQYFFENSGQLQDYVDQRAPIFIDLLRKNFPDRHAVFNTLLEEV